MKHLPLSFSQGVQIGVRGPASAFAPMSYRRIQIDFPQLGYAVENAIIDTAVIRACNLKHAAEPSFVRILLEIDELLANTYRTELIARILHSPITRRNHVPRDNVVRHFEGGILSKHPVWPRCVAVFDDHEVFEAMSPEA